VQDAKQIKIIPVANAGSADICDLIRDKVRTPGGVFSPLLADM
jgi:hypothetical protein